MTGNKCKSTSAEVAISKPQKNLRELVLAQTFTKRLLPFAILAFSLPLAYGESLSGEIFDLGKKSQLYTFQVTEISNGDSLTQDSVCKTLEGQVSVHEMLELDHGRLKKYSIEHPLIHQNGTVEIAGNQVLFSYTQDGKAKRDHEDFKENTIVPPTTIDFVRSHWDALMKGEFVDARFASAERRETVGFEFFKNGTEEYDGKPAVLIRMRPSSIFISAIVKPMTLVFDRVSKRLLEFHGRILPKKGTKDIDGIVVYHYESPPALTTH